MIGWWNASEVYQDGFSTFFVPDLLCDLPSRNLKLMQIPPRRIFVHCFARHALYGSVVLFV